MGIFPLIESTDDIQALLSKRGIHLNPVGDYQVLAYGISNKDTFDTMLAREARGLTFDRAGKLVARPLHKFFNIGENEQVSVAALRGRPIARIMDKRDGSMVHTVDAGGGAYILKTKKSIEAEQAQAAQRLATEHGGADLLCRHCVASGATAIFEFTSRESRIVVDYPRAELRLLHVRDNRTGDYWMAEALRELAGRFDVALVDDCDWGSTIEELLAEAEARVGVEGGVVQFADGEMAKFKTAWYTRLHGATVFARERDIARLVLLEQIDDLRPRLPQLPEIVAQIDAIERRVSHAIADLTERVEALAQEARANGWDRKAFAMAKSKDKLFAPAMDRFNGKEPDVRKLYLQRHLDVDFGLTPLGDLHPKD